MEIILCWLICKIKALLILDYSDWVKCNILISITIGKKKSPIKIFVLFWFGLAVVYFLNLSSNIVKIANNVNDGVNLDPKIF